MNRFLIETVGNELYITDVRCCKTKNLSKGYTNSTVLFEKGRCPQQGLLSSPEKNQFLSAAIMKLRIMFEKLTAASQRCLILYVFVMLKDFLTVNCQQSRRFNDSGVYVPAAPGDPNYRTFVYNNRRYGSTPFNDPYFYNPQLGGSLDSSGAYIPNAYDPSRQAPTGQLGSQLDVSVASSIIIHLIYRFFQQYCFLKIDDDCDKEMIG